MKNVALNKCPNCGGPMNFDPDTGKLVCDYCGTIAEIEEKKPAEEPKKQAEEQEKEELQGFDFKEIEGRASDGQASPLPVYSCTMCGAELIAPAEQAALTCPYCGNNIVLTDKVTGPLRPDGVVPFRITSKTLPAEVSKFYKDKVLLPKRFFSESTMGKVTGVYVPFWVFSGRLSGILKYRAQKSSSHRSGDYIITNTDHYSLARDVKVDFENLTVDASGRIDDALMDSLEPFDMKDVKPFDMRYLAGFTADRFDRTKNDIEDRAKKRMFNTAETLAQARASAGYDSARKTGGSLKADIKALYMLLPVYLFDIEYGGSSYSFAVNGQTGKVVGNIPTDKGVSRLFFLKRAGLVAAAVLLFFIARYFMGR